MHLCPHSVWGTPCVPKTHHPCIKQFYSSDSNPESNCFWTYRHLEETKERERYKPDMSKKCFIHGHRFKILYMLTWCSQIQGAELWTKCYCLMSAVAIIFTKDVWSLQEPITPLGRSSHEIKVFPYLSCMDNFPLGCWKKNKGSTPWTKVRAKLGNSTFNQQSGAFFLQLT